MLAMKKSNTKIVLKTLLGKPNIVTVDRNLEYVLPPKQPDLTAKSNDYIMFSLATSNQFDLTPIIQDDNNNSSGDLNEHFKKIARSKQIQKTIHPGFAATGSPKPPSGDAAGFSDYMTRNTLFDPSHLATFRKMIDLSTEKPETLLPNKTRHVSLVFPFTEHLSLSCTYVDKSPIQQLEYSVVPSTEVDRSNVWVGQVQGYWICCLVLLISLFIEVVKFNSSGDCNKHLKKITQEKTIHPGFATAGSRKPSSGDASSGGRDDEDEDNCSQKPSSGHVDEGDSQAEEEGNSQVGDESEGDAQAGDVGGGNLGGSPNISLDKNCSPKLEEQKRSSTNLDSKVTVVAPNHPNTALCNHSMNTPTVTFENGEANGEATSKRKQSVSGKKIKKSKTKAKRRLSRRSTCARRSSRSNTQQGSGLYGSRGASSNDRDDKNEDRCNRKSNIGNAPRTLSDAAHLPKQTQGNRSMNSLTLMNGKATSKRMQAGSGKTNDKNTKTRAKGSQSSSTSAQQSSGSNSRQGNSLCGSGGSASSGGRDDEDENDCNHKPNNGHMNEGDNQTRDESEGDGQTKDDRATEGSEDDDHTVKDGSSHPGGSLNISLDENCDPKSKQPQIGSSIAPNVPVIAPNNDIPSQDPPKATNRINVEKYIDSEPSQNNMILSGKSPPSPRVVRHLKAPVLLSEHSTRKDSGTPSQSLPRADLTPHPRQPPGKLVTSLPNAHPGVLDQPWNVGEQADGQEYFPSSVKEDIPFLGQGDLVAPPNFVHPDVYPGGDSSPFSGQFVTPLPNTHPGSLDQPDEGWNVGEQADVYPGGDSSPFHGQLVMPLPNAHPGAGQPDKGYQQESKEQSILETKFLTRKRSITIYCVRRNIEEWDDKCEYPPLSVEEEHFFTGPSCFIDLTCVRPVQVHSSLPSTTLSHVTVTQAIVPDNPQLNIISVVANINTAHGDPIQLEEQP